MKENICIVVDIHDENQVLSKIRESVKTVWNALDEASNFELTGIFALSDLNAWLAPDIRTTKNCILVRNPDNDGAVSDESKAFINTAQNLGKKFYVIGSVNQQVSLFPKTELDEVEAACKGLRRVIVK